MALDAAGNIYVAGNTNTLDLPTTPEALLEKGYGPYVRKISPSGAVIWSTYLTGNRVGVGTPVYPADVIRAVAVSRDDGSVFIAGGGSPNWPTTMGAYSTKYEGPNWHPFGPAGPRNAFVAKLNASGTAFAYSTFIDYNDGSLPNAIAVDASGSAYVSGGTPDYIVQLHPAGTALLRDNRYPEGSRSAHIVLDTNHGIHASGGNTGVVTVLSPALASSGLYGVANAAGTAVTGRVAAGELISIYGWSLGDRVFFNDTPGAILYASDEQINTIVPFSVRVGAPLKISVRRAGIETASAVVAVAAAHPELFKTRELHAAALNQDGSVNSEQNPASVGSVVTVWGTGAAGWAPATEAGSINRSDPLQYLPVGAVVSEPSPSQVQFAGAAPGLVAGVFQINLKLPDNIYFFRDVQTLALYPVAGLERGGPAYIFVKR